eukprot:6184724-Pleurochrysis_carterae.AAC.2
MPQEHQSTENATGLTESPCAHDTPPSTPRFALWLAPPPEAAAELSHTIQQATFKATCTVANTYDYTMRACR